MCETAGRRSRSGTNTRRFPAHMLCYAASGLREVRGPPPEPTCGTNRRPQLPRHQIVPCVSEPRQEVMVCVGIIRVGRGQASLSGNILLLQSSGRTGARSTCLGGTNGEPPVSLGTTCFKEAIANGRRQG